MKFVLVVVFLAIVGLLCVTLALRPQAVNFAQTEEIRGRIEYGGRYANARLGLRNVFSGASALGGTNLGFSQVPNGAEIVARVALIQTLLGPARIIVKATSAADGRTLIERTPAQCLEDWDKATLLMLSTVVMTAAAVLIGVFWLFVRPTTRPER